MAKYTFPTLEGAWSSQSLSNNDANPLGSIHRVNMSRINQLSHSLECPPKKEKKKLESLADLLERRQSEILEQVVQNERSATRQRIEQLEEERLAQDWEVEKERFLKELAGDRVLRGSSKHPAPASLSLVHTLAVSTVQTSDLHAIAQSHLQIVARWNRDPGMNAVEEFSRIATPSMSPAYSMAWRLLAATDGKSSPPSVATGALAHLSRQFQNYIINRVQSASLAGQDVSLPITLLNGMANTVATFVKLEHGSTASVWPIIYYCLRCGDAVAAMNVLDFAGTEVDGPICQVVASMAQLQGASLCLWDRSMDRIDRKAIRENKPRSNDLYVEACWTLLSASESLQGRAVRTIEDYLFGNLWYAVQQSNATELLEGLGKSIIDFGPKYFDENEESSGWSYALPLLLTQQYQTALTHLANVGNSLGLLQATHLAMAMREIQDLGNVAFGEQPMLTTLLVEFSRQMQIADAPAALEYLVRIPNPDRRRSETARLLVETRQFEALAGQLSRDGMRQGMDSALDQHFSSSEITDILEEAADLAISKNNPRDAMELLNLAERYDLLLQLLNQKLATHVNQSATSEMRQSWKVTAQQFHSWHLEGPRTHVMDILMKQKQTSLVQTSRIILKLFDFFDALAMRDFQQACNIVDSIGVLPSSKSDLQVKEREYHSLDPLVREIFPAVLLGAMSALYQQHESLKHNCFTVNKGTAMQRLAELRDRSCALMSFSGSLNMINSSEQLAMMARMEASMV